MTAVIQVSNLSKWYGKFQALNDLSFSVSKGDFLAFLGPNGAGKTTTIGCITGLCQFSQGSILVKEHDIIKNYRQSRPLIGLCPQEFNLDPFLSIDQLLRYQAGYFGLNDKTAKDRASYLLNEFGLYEKKNEDMRKLSGGMKRRLLLCRALIHDPEILILDEPTAGADLEVRIKIWDYLQQINSQGKTVILTTHYMEEAQKLSKNTIIVNKGQIAYNGTTKNLCEGADLQERFLEIIKNG